MFKTLGFESFDIVSDLEFSASDFTKKYEKKYKH